MPSISISLSDTELLDLKSSAYAQGSSVSEYIRNLLNPNITKVKQAIREQRGLTKSVMMSISCHKRETYEYEVSIYHYIHDVDYVFVMDETLYPICQGHAFPDAVGTIGKQSILYAILCTIPINGVINNGFWEDLRTCFKPLMKLVDVDGNYKITLNNFTFERISTPAFNQYNYYLTSRD